MLNAAKWIEERHGRASLEQVLAGCSPAVRDRVATEIAVNWHPQEEFCEFLDVAERAVGTGDGRLSEAVGAAGALASTQGMLMRAAFYLARPPFLMKRIANAWQHYNDEGDMTFDSLEKTAATIEVRGLRRPHWYFCCTVTGWAGEIARRFSGRQGSARHLECRARGAERCVWDVRWQRVGDA